MGSGAFDGAAQAIEKGMQLFAFLVIAVPVLICLGIPGAFLLGMYVG